jgi:hypothetical protein
VGFERIKLTSMGSIRPSGTILWWDIWDMVGYGGIPKYSTSILGDTKIFRPSQMEHLGGHGKDVQKHVRDSLTRIFYIPLFRHIPHDIWIYFCLLVDLPL